MKRLLKQIAGMCSPEIVERFLAHSLLSIYLKQGLDGAKKIRSREKLWDHVIDNVGQKKPLVYLEFGVWKGYSIKFFADKLTNPLSIFIGSDSFEGLPEDWGARPKGSFDTGGEVPITNDSRISFAKGWFQNTFDDVIASVRPHHKSFLVHFDADVYSSTLFLLTKLDDVANEYWAIFDEFLGHESRALWNYVQAYGASVEFLAATYERGYPMQVFCKIRTGKGKNFAPSDKKLFIT